jgi:hypothetical protein
MVVVVQSSPRSRADRMKQKFTTFSAGRTLLHREAAINITSQWVRLATSHSHARPRRVTPRTRTHNDNQLPHPPTHPHTHPRTHPHSTGVDQQTTGLHSSAFLPSHCSIACSPPSPGSLSWLPLSTLQALPRPSVRLFLARVRALAIYEDPRRQVRHRPHSVGSER